VLQVPTLLNQQQHQTGNAGCWDHGLVVLKNRNIHFVVVKKKK
jgi:hypothetical protein